MITPNYPTILVKCERPDLTTQYARFTLKDDRLEIAYVKADTTHVVPILVNEQTDVLFYREYPEARALHDTTGWNLAELLAWTGTLTHANAVQWLTTLPKPEEESL